MRFPGITGLVLLLSVIALASCTTFQLSGTQVTKQIPSYTSVGTFDITIRFTSSWEAPAARTCST